MKKHLSVIFLFLFFGARAQKIQTIVPTQPVVVGNAFQIQYIIQEPSSLVNLTPPSFDGVQVVSGPNHYKGNTIVDGRSVAIENITYTLVPIKTGFLKINGLTGAFRSGDEKTDDAIVEVVPQPKASFSTRSSYTEVSLYAPASKTDLEKLIAENLFVRTIVDKTSCFIGEPVTATFKLYSRLQSTSEVINSPSLYGFTVMDILNTNEAHQSVETIGGKVFNTSVLRKLQLYPGQPGRLVIDPMQLQNEIDFDDSIDHHKKRIQKLLSSNPVVISVKPLPEKKPDSYTGAVGRFSIEAKSAEQLTAGQQGHLVLVISGKGNFIQFGPPQVQLPPSFEVFDPVVTDKLNKNAVPAEGSRAYDFSFTADSTGHYDVRAASFSFFDPSSAKYKTIEAGPISIDIVPGRLEDTRPLEKANGKGYFRWWLPAIGIVVLAGIIIFFTSRSSKAKAGAPMVHATNKTAADDLQGLDIESMTDKQACSEITRILNEARRANPTLSLAIQEEMQSIQKDCQLLIYSDMDTSGERNELKKRAVAVLRKMV